MVDTNTDSTDTQSAEETEPQSAEETKPVSDKQTKPVSDKKRGKRGTKEQKEPDDKKIKTAVHLSREAINKLGAACVYEMKNQSQLIEHLITQQLSTYSVSAREQDHRIKFAASSDRPKPAAGVSASHVIRS